MEDSIVFNINNPRVIRHFYGSRHCSSAPSISCFNINMYLISILFLITIAYWLYTYTQYQSTIWEDMVESYPSIIKVKEVCPEYYERFISSLQHSESVFYTLITNPMTHRSHSYQQLRDNWQETINRWEQIAIAPVALFLQEEVAAGSRILTSYCMSRLESLRKYDTNPYRTVWLGEGQPHDPQDTIYRTISLV